MSPWRPLRSTPLTSETGSMRLQDECFEVWACISMSILISSFHGRSQGRASAGEAIHVARVDIDADEARIMGRTTARIFSRARDSRPLRGSRTSFPIKSYLLRIGELPLPGQVRMGPGNNVWAET